MIRRRLLPFIALVMLLASLFSTEAAEVWCRVAVGATADVDDDDGLYFSCRPDGDAARRSEAARQGARVASVAATRTDSSMVDEPTFNLPHPDLAVPPAAFGRVVFPAKTTARAAETCGPPTRADYHVRPPPRAPPLS